MAKIRNVLRVGFSAGFALLLSACSGDAASETGHIGSTNEAWSTSACLEASSDSTASGFIAPAQTSPQTYNNCTKSYVWKITNYSSNYAGGGSRKSLIAVTWGDDIPTTAADCEDTEGGAILYKLVNGDWQALTGQVYATGVWGVVGVVAGGAGAGSAAGGIGGAGAGVAGAAAGGAGGAFTAILGCIPPSVTVSDDAAGGMVAGATYHIAATMRRISGGNPTRKISILSERAVR